MLSKKTQFSLLAAWIGLFSLYTMSGCVSRFYYFPTNKQYYTPEEMGFRYQEFWIDSTDGVRLHAWYIPAANAKGTIVHFHGNAENISSHFLSLLWLVNQGFNLLTFDYRGYGQSTGTPSPRGTHDDALRILNFADSLAVQDRTKLIVYGQSLGGVIALRAVPEWKRLQHLSAVVIEGSFLSYREIGHERLKNFCFWPVPVTAASLLDDSYNARDAVKQIAPVPLIVLHGTHDPVVPYGFGQEIYAQANRPRVLLTIQGGGHLFWNQQAAQPYRLKFAALLIGLVSGKNLNELMREFGSSDRT